MCSVTHSDLSHHELGDTQWHIKSCHIGTHSVMPLYFTKDVLLCHIMCHSVLCDTQWHSARYAMWHTVTHEVVSHRDAFSHASLHRHMAIPHNSPYCTHTHTHTHFSNIHTRPYCTHTSPYYTHKHSPWLHTYITYCILHYCAICCVCAR